MLYNTNFCWNQRAYWSSVVADMSSARNQKTIISSFCTGTRSSDSTQKITNESDRTKNNLQNIYPSKISTRLSNLYRYSCITQNTIKPSYSIYVNIIYHIIHQKSYQLEYQTSYKILSSLTNRQKKIALSI